MISFFVCLCVFIDLEWKIIYVGSAESEEYDQVLDSVLVGPVPAGRHMFVFQVCFVGAKRYFMLFKDNTLSWNHCPWSNPLILHLVSSVGCCVDCHGMLFCYLLLITFSVSL